MSLFSVQARKHTAFYDHLMTTSRKATDTTLGKSEITSGESACEDSRSSDKSRQVNRTYVVSALSKSGSGQQTPGRGRLTLQRRSRRRTAEKTMVESSQNSTPAPEKRLTLQRRTRTPSMDKSAHGQRGVSGAGLQTTPKVLSEPNGRTPSLFRSISLRESATKGQRRETAAAAKVESQAHSKTPSSSTSRQLQDQAQTFKTPTKKTPFGKIAARRDVFERLAAKEAPKPVAVKSASLERPKSRTQQAGDAKPVAAPRVSKVSAGVHRPHASLRARETSTSNQKGDLTPAPAPAQHTLSRPSEALSVKQHNPLKMENSALTVAVRVRPFSARFVMHCLPSLMCNMFGRSRWCLAAYLKVWFSRSCCSAFWMSHLPDPTKHTSDDEPNVHFV